MHIEGLFIENFGKIKNLRLRFNDGMNVVFGENESGKTTVQTFIKGILYDLDKSNVEKDGISELFKYKPWEGEAYGGYIELRTDGGKYIKIVRDFNEGTFKAYDQHNTDITQTFKHGRGYLAPGDKLFGINKLFFEKTAFIRQRGTRISQYNNEDLASKLDNILKTGFMDVSYDYASKILNDSLVKCVGNDGYSSGILQEVNSKLLDLESAKTEGIQSNSNTSIIEEHLERLKKRKTINQNKKQILQAIKDCVNINEEINEKNSLKEHVEDLLAEVEEKANLYNAKKGKTSEYERIAERLKESSASGDINDDIFEKYRKYLNVIEDKKDLSQNIEQKSKQITELESNLDSNTNIEFIEKDENYNKLRGIYEKLNILKQEQIQSEDNNFVSKEKKSKRAYRINLNVLILFFIISIAHVYSVFIPNTGEFIPSFYTRFVLIGLYGFGALTAIMLILTIIFSVKYAKAKSMRVKNDEIGAQIEHNINEYMNELNGILKIAKVKDLTDFLKARDVYNENLSIINKNKDELEILKKDLEKKSDEETSYFKDITDKLILFEIIKDSQQEFSERDIFRYRQIIENQEDIHREKSSMTTDLAKDENMILQLMSKISLLMGIGEFEHDKVDDALDELNKSVSQMQQLLINSQDRLNVVLSNFEDDDYYDLKNISDRIFANERVSLAYVEQKHSEILEDEIRLIEEIKVTESDLDKVIFNEKEIRKRDNDRNSLIRKREFAEESVQALNISLKVLGEASKEVRKSFTPFINARMQKIIQAITNGRHKDIVADESLDISFIGEKENSNILTETLDYLSDGTVDQVYIAMRIAMSDFMSADTENIPVIIDEAFSQYDDNRIYNTLNYLNENRQNKQLMFFSCKKRELDITKDIYKGNLNIIYL